LKLKLSNVDLLLDVSKMWLNLKKFKEAKDCLEQALKARPSKDST
jgi:hypothetical protein